MKSRINSFFIEIIIVILFFSLSAMVILQLFVASHDKNASANQSNIAMIKAQNITEEFLADNDLSNKKDIICYDKDWNETTDIQFIIYRLEQSVTIEETESGSMLFSKVKIFAENPDKKSESEICKLDSQKFVPES